MKIEEIDKNFAIPSFEGLDIEWYDIRKAPFKLYGLMDDGKKFYRMPLEVAEKVNDGVKSLSTYASGGRVRFATDSPFVALVAEQPEFYIFAHMTALGTAGFDLYCDEGKNKGFVGSFQPDCATKKTRNVVQYGGRDWEKGGHNFTINFPLYTEVYNVYVGVQKGSTLSEGKEYEDKLPIVYYGSSITQGGCASRPGTCYQNLICAINNIDYLNLGFSGSAKGEKEMAEYISKIPMSAFVYDYDYNADTSDDLRKMHKPFYDIVREKNPDLPIIILSRPCVKIDDYDHLKRRDIVKETYELAMKNNDNVYFIDGSTVFEGEWANECTVDYIHPTDVGFAFMAKRINEILCKVL